MEPTQQRGSYINPILDQNPSGWAQGAEGRAGCAPVGGWGGSAPPQHHKCHVTQGGDSPEGQEWSRGQPKLPAPWLLHPSTTWSWPPIPHSCSAHRPQAELPGFTFGHNSVSCKLSRKSQANNKHGARPFFLTGSMQSCFAGLAAALQLSCAPCRDPCHQGAKNCPWHAKSSWPVQNGLP